MAIKFAFLPPDVAPGKNVAEFLAIGSYVLKSDVVNYNDSSPVNVFQAPANCLVEGVICEVITAFDGTIPSVALGVSGTPGRHANTNDIDVKTAGFYAVMKSHEYTALTSLICTIIGGGATQGKVRFWLIYRPKSDVPSSNPAL